MMRSISVSEDIVFQDFGHETHLLSEKNKSEILGNNFLYAILMSKF